jgi:hypothetical protein
MKNRRSTFSDVVVVLIFQVLLNLTFFPALASGQAWIQLNPAGTLPVGRVNSTTVYIHSINRMLLFGGYPVHTNATIQTPTNDLWALDGANGSGTAQWTQLMLPNAAGSPPPRTGAPAFYDASSNRMILFGGQGGPEISWAARNDVWVLTNADGTTGTPTWLQLSITGQTPPPRGGHAAAYDPATNSLIVYGGSESLNGLGGCPCNSYSDTWVLSNANGASSQPPAWTQLAPTGTAPTLAQTAFAYDSAQNVFIIYGGFDASGNGQTATWLLTHANGVGGTPAWGQLATIGSPQQSGGATAGYDSATQRFILFGGETNSATGATTNAVYVLTNATGSGTPTWQLLNPSGTPPLTRTQATAAYDSTDNSLLIFGGQQLSPTFLTLNDSWVLTGANGVLSSQVAITQIVPNRGGSAGSVTAEIFGSGFQGGAAVKLSGSGADISGSNVTVLNSSSLSTTFLLSEATPGVRNIVVTNPDGTAATLNGGFTVVSGGSASLAINIVGRDVIRFDSPQQYYAEIHNQGLVDAEGVAAFVNQSNIPVSTSANPLNAPAASLFGSPSAFFGPIGAGSSVLIPITALGPPSASCSYINSGVHILQPTDPCAAFEAMKAASETYIEFLYVARLANLQLLMRSIIPTSQGGLGLCYNPIIPGSKIYCKPLRAIDDILDGLINAAESSENGLCALASAAGCPLNCTDPSAIGLLENVAQAVGAEIDNLDALFAVNIDLSKVALADAQVSSSLAQSLALPGSLTFPTQPQPQPATAIPVNISSSLQACGVGSIDPNSKVGPRGVGSPQFVQGASDIPYSISFGNASTATAPAQAVTVSDSITGTLDSSTIALGPITLPSQLITPPPVPLSVSPFSTTIDLRPSINLLVNISASLDPTKNVLTWTFQSLDPATNQPPTDPTVGFLPPGGEGSIFLNVVPKQGLPTNSQVNNQAEVVFDTNPAISTPIWFNTLDNTPPTSSVIALPPFENALNFPVQWSGTDVGAGIQDFTIYVSDNAGPFTAFQTNTTATSATFAGQAGHSYGFYSIGRDLVGNVEPAKSTDEASTQTGIAFSSLTARAEISTNARHPGFELSGTLTVGTGTTGIAPDTQPVSLVLGNFSVVIPAGSFRKNKNGRYSFEGTINGVHLEFSIAPAGGSSFTFHVEADGANLSGTGNPVPLELLIGTNGGTTQVTAEID